MDLPRAAVKPHRTSAIFSPSRPPNSSLTSTGVFEHDLIVQTQSELRHTRQVTLHLDGSQNFASNHSSGRVDLFDMAKRVDKRSTTKPHTPDSQLTSKLTLSTTSKNTSFFRYLIPSDLHDTAFVTATGGLTTSSLCDS
jgi:hypothetical protein